MWKIIIAALLLVAGCQTRPIDPFFVPLKDDWSSSILDKSGKVVIGRTPYPDSAYIVVKPKIVAMYFPEFKKTCVFVDGRVYYKNIRGGESQAFFSIQWDSPGNSYVTGTISPTLAKCDFSDMFLNATGDLPPP